MVQTKLAPDQLDTGVMRSFDTLAEAVASTFVEAGDSADLKERTTGNGGGAMWDYVLSSGVTNNTYNIVQCTGVGTLSLVLRIEDVADVVAIGADRSGAISATAAFQAANDALPSTGGVISCPGGTYLLDTTSVALSSNTKVVGIGDGTLFDCLGAGQSFSALSKTNVGIESVNFLNENSYVNFDLCTGVYIKNVSAQGVITASGEFSQFAFRVTGCDEVLVENPNFDNFNYGVFFLISDNDGTTVCGTVRVTGGLIQHSDTTHGVALNNPSGVNGWQVENLHVDHVTFKNIKPSTGIYYGFGVYEGDGTVGNLKTVTVDTCHFIDDDGTSAYRMVGVLTSVAEKTIINNCDFVGDFMAIRDGTPTTIVSNCLFDGAWSDTSSLTGNTPIVHKYTGNTWKNVTSTFPFICMNGNNGGSLPLLVFTDNTLDTCKYGVYVRLVTYAHLVGNTLIDLNTDGISDATAGSGFNFFGCQRGFVDGNTIMNISTGLMEYGVSNPSTGVSQVYITENNNIKGMTVSSVKNTASAPSIGSWDAGQNWHYWAPSAAGAPGSVCVTAGTLGTLNSGNTTGAITSGTASLVVSTADFLEVGQKITIVGVTGTKNILSISGTTVTIDVNADATVSGAAVAWFNAVFKTKAVLAA